ncbi:MAG: corrinoid protein-associated methyltransferase CpaM [Candidatus Aminicenantaceae bacterium]
MSTYVLMKILEKIPRSYDKGLWLVTRGKLEKVYDELTRHIKKGDIVLDLGCGTGALTLRAAKRGAKVKGIDVNPRMLDIAKSHLREAKLTENVELYDMGVAELGSEEREKYDAVTSGLCFSELTENEFSYTMSQVKRILKPGGLLLVGDEVRPTNILKKLFTVILRIPLRIATYLLTQNTTRALQDLPGRIQSFGFLIESIKLNKRENFIELVARKTKK